MSVLKVSDFYYGAVLSKLLSDKITPALIEGGVDRQIYEFTTDLGDFRLFLKYRSKEINTKKLIIPVGSSLFRNLTCQKFTTA